MLRNIVGTPARGDDFYGREDLVDLVWNRLEAGNVLLAAPRRFGKTSLMYRLIDEPRQGWKPVHIDAESIREPANFIIAVLDALMADRQLRSFLIQAWKGSRGWLRDLVNSLEITTPWDVGVKMSLKEKIAPEWAEHGVALLEVLREYEPGTKVLLIIDELPLMLRLFADNDITDAETRGFLYWFRKLRTDPHIGLANCRFLVGGSIGIEYYLSRLRAADSFNDFERVSLPELTAEKAEAFVRLLLDERDLALSPECQNCILELVGAPIPYFIQIFVSEIAAARANDAVEFTPGQIESLYHDQVLGSACKTYFQHYYDRLCQYEKPRERAAKTLLKSISIAQADGVGRDDLRAAFQEVLGEQATDDDFARLIGDLENDFYIRFYRDRNGYAFASKILCDWWRRYYAL